MVLEKFSYSCHTITRKAEDHHKVLYYIQFMILEKFYFSMAI